jgi:hypothetical protein
MTDTKFAEALVVLNVPPSLEEPLVDWLLAREDGAGFTSFPVFGHSTRHDHLSAAEQVSGRQRRQQFQVQMAAVAVEQFLDDVRASLGGAGIHYWVIPVIGGGHLGPRDTSKPPPQP